MRSGGKTPTKIFILSVRCVRPNGSKKSTRRINAQYNRSRVKHVPPFSPVTKSESEATEYYAPATKYPINKVYYSKKQKRSGRGYTFLVANTALIPLD